MNLSNKEAKLLCMLRNGELDGQVGETRIYRLHSSVQCGRYIKDGIPTVYREGKLRTSLFETEESPPMLREEKKHLSTESQIEFLRKFGWLMSNNTVREYSQSFKPTEAERKNK